ncbi:MAG: phosphatidate cytidylyltransferase, partial [Gammaproteobacteria bacterium]|nr:phosphatidate cytidylyltransferase [Gammaproteobacteria bacterium]
KNTYIVVFIGGMLASLALMQSSFLFFLFLSASVGWWLVQIAQLSSYAGETGIEADKSLENLWTGVALLVPTWASLVFIHQDATNGPQLVLFLMILIWSADSGAYFSGRKFGKNKLAPLVSPGKTKEGAYGAFAASGIVAFIGGIWLELGFFQFIFFMVLSMVVVVFSIGGDLLESVYKRKAEIKDSGTLLPGHGGVLDRIDSLMSASPVFALGIWLLGIIE